MFDVVKDINSELVIMDQFLSSKGSDLYMNICANTEVVKSGNKENFRNYIFNSVNPKMRAYLTNGALTIDVKYEAAYFLLFNGIVEFLHVKELGFDDKDLSLISQTYSLSDQEKTLSEHFIKKYGEDKKDQYLENAKKILPVIQFAMEAYTTFKAAKSDFVISQKHIDSLKILMGKEFMDKVEGVEPSEEKVPTKGSSKKSGGCYVATCVYHSYDCPEVWMLRRYRDNYLKNHLFGRIFISVYYSISPTIVRLFGKTKWFNKFFKNYLDKKLIKLKDRGYSDLPYLD